MLVFQGVGEWRAGMKWRSCSEYFLHSSLQNRALTSSRLHSLLVMWMSAIDGEGAIVFPEAVVRYARPVATIFAVRSLPPAVNPPKYGAVLSAIELPVTFMGSPRPVVFV